MGDPLNHHAARHVAVVKLFLELVEDLWAAPQSNLHPSQHQVLAAIDPRIYALLHQSAQTATTEMNQLAPAVLAGATLHA